MNKIIVKVNYLVLSYSTTKENKSLYIKQK